MKKDELLGLGRSQRSTVVVVEPIVLPCLTRDLRGEEEGAFMATKTEEKTEVKAVVISLFVPNLLPENALEWQKVTHYC